VTHEIGSEGYFRREAPITSAMFVVSSDASEVDFAPFDKYRAPGD
jgi:hypothetical protein